DLERAAASLEAALAFNPDHPVAPNTLGFVRRRHIRFAEARARYERALAVLPDFHFATKNLALVCALYPRDLACALANHEADAALVPDDENAAFWIADLRSRVAP